MDKNKVVSKDAWLVARKEFLAKEKSFTKARDELSRQRRELPWVKIDKAYIFDTNEGKKGLNELFADRSQLMIYHFMLGPGWQGGCPSCSLIADNFQRSLVHLAQRDISLVAVSRAPLKEINAFRTKMEWDFEWVSSFSSDFNFDFYVSHKDEDVKGKVFYNFAMTQAYGSESPGLSVFYKNEKNEIFHTYSTYARGLDALIGTYQYIDLAPKGRNEESLPYGMAWVRYHNQYALK